MSQKFLCLVLIIIGWNISFAQSGSTPKSILWGKERNHINESTIEIFEISGGINRVVHKRGKSLSGSMDVIFERFSEDSLRLEFRAKYEPKIGRKRLVYCFSKQIDGRWIAFSTADYYNRHERILYGQEIDPKSLVPTSPLMPLMEAKNANIRVNNEGIFSVKLSENTQVFSIGLQLLNGNRGVYELIVQVHNRDLEMLWSSTLIGDKKRHYSTENLAVNNFGELFVILGPSLDYRSDGRITHEGEFELVKVVEKERKGFQTPLDVKDWVVFDLKLAMKEEHPIVVGSYCRIVEGGPEGVFLFEFDRGKGEVKNSNYLDLVTGYQQMDYRTDDGLYPQFLIKKLLVHQDGTMSVVFEKEAFVFEEFKGERLVLTREYFKDHILSSNDVLVVHLGQANNWMQVFPRRHEVGFTKRKYGELFVGEDQGELFLFYNDHILNQWVEPGESLHNFDPDNNNLIMMHLNSEGRASKLVLTSTFESKAVPRPRHFVRNAKGDIVLLSENQVSIRIGRLIF